jgi:RNA polymerase sigma-70 factor (ECF subfamily)
MTVQAASQPGKSAVDSDEALMQRLRNGDAIAGDVLVKRHYSALSRYLQRLAGNHVAEELLQQTWLSVLDHADKFDPDNGGGGFKSWLFRIATNKANDHWRTRGREKAAHAGLKLVYDDHAPHADHRMEGVEQDQKLVKAIAQLPDAQRQVLMLRYYSDMKFVDIAELLGCPLNTALGRAHKAMIRLKELMTDGS